MVNCPHFVLLYLFFIGLHVLCCWLCLYPPDSLLCLCQPVRKLLQLLLLKIHQDFMEPGEKESEGRRAVK